MSKSIRNARWLLVALLVVAGYRLSNSASADSTAVQIARTAAEPAAPTADAEVWDALMPQATCAAIKCPPGKVCVNTQQCTPSGDCYHVGRCVSLP